MSNAKQILAMIRSRVRGDDEQFYSIALQVAAAEARSGRRTTAQEIRAAVDDARGASSSRPGVSIPIAKPRGDLQGLLELRTPKFALDDVVIHDELRYRLDDLLRQQLKRDWLREHGKVPNRRVLFTGPPGSGKTMTAEALAWKLKLPLFVIRLDALITRFMGETAAKLRLVFDEAHSRRGVYLFDEFDAVGGKRESTNDVAEMRRVLNSFLQFMEERDSTDSVIVAATNHPELLDKALLRRFDLVLEFRPPTDEQIRKLIASNLKPMKYPRLSWKSIASNAKGLSQSEIVRAAEDAVKMAILDEKNVIQTADIVSRLKERREMREAFSKREGVLT